MRISEAYSIPDHLWQDIKRYDRRIEVKWDGRAQQVRVERFGQHILSFEPRPENFYKLLHTLHAQDTWRRGGFCEDNSAVVAQQIEDDAAATAKRIQDYWNDRRMWEAKEAWGYMNTVRCVSEKHAHTAPAGGMSIN